MRVLSPAKINLHLRVGPRQSDGFHPLVSWMHTVGLFDTLNFEEVLAADFPPDFAGDSPATSSAETAAGSGLRSIRLTCSDPSLPVDGQNLVVRAANALLAEASAPRGVRIDLAKAIPHGGGLGGGSGNAATTLTSLNQLWRLDLGRDVLDRLAASLGSDVPFFLHGPSAICRGRGEIIEPAPAFLGRWAMLLLPDIAMPTPAVYRQFDEMNDKINSAARDWDRNEDWKGWSTLPAIGLMEHLKNDLEAPAFQIRPDLQVLKDSAEQRLQRTVRMSGSGSTLFTLYDSQAEAMAASTGITGVRSAVVPLLGK